ncbi:hypothetical protein [Lentzea aerocolonigenes]|nr:hypothetical protein [Lentzea aerocolonigenes]
MENQQLADLADMSSARLQEFMESARSSGMTQGLAGTGVALIAQVD